jgi:hypothetical protein
VLCEMDAVEMSEIDEKSVSFFWRCFAFLSSSRSQVSIIPIVSISISI